MTARARKLGRRHLVPEPQLRWLDDSGAFIRGTHTGDLLSDVAARDPGYLTWIIEQVIDIDDLDLQRIETARAGAKDSKP